MKHSYPLIAARLFCEPWACLPEVHQSVCEQFRAHVTGAPLEVQGGADDPVGPTYRDYYTGQVGHYHPQVEVFDKVALLSVSGIIGKGLSTLEMECGGYDIGLMADQMRNIADDEAIETVVISINSPGGAARGVGQAAESIRRVAESGKKVIAYTDGTCCSAAYWLAAAADEIHAEPSAIVGSISTYIAAVDSSRRWDMAGMELKLFRTGSLKAIGHAGKKWTDEEEAFMRERVEAVDSDFKGFVGTRRGLTAAEMNGAFWDAARSPKGLVDSTSFGNLRELLESIFATS
jgi:signal peptide peptidase SppA